MPEYELKIKPSELYEEARRLLKAKPEFRYHGGDSAQRDGENFLGGCEYIEDGQGSCVMGQALQNLGVPVDWIAMHEGSGIRAFFNSHNLTTHEAEYLPILGKMQMMQDRNFMWSEIDMCIAAGVLH